MQVMLVWRGLSRLVGSSRSGPGIDTWLGENALAIAPRPFSSATTERWLERLLTLILYSCACTSGAHTAMPSYPRRLVRRLPFASRARRMGAQHLTVSGISDTACCSRIKCARFSCAFADVRAFGVTFCRSTSRCRLRLLRTDEWGPRKFRRRARPGYLGTQGDVLDAHKDMALASSAR